MYKNQLTASKKAKYLPIIIARDGKVCFYCKMPSVEEVERWKMEYDHLNNNPFDNRTENLVIVHRECNNKKKTYVDCKF